MRISESREQVPADLDVLVVLGKNLGVDWDAARIRAEPDYLSPDSRLNVLAAGMLFEHWGKATDAEPTTELLLSGGQTIGPAPDFPSQPEAARTLLLQRFPSIPKEKTSLDETGIDTAASARTMRDFVDAERYHRIGLLSVGYHLKNALQLFTNHGVAVACAVASEAIVAEHSPIHRQYVTDWRNEPRMQQEARRELIRGFLIRTIDPRGTLLRRFTASRAYPAA